MIRPSEAALAADKTSVVSAAKTSVVSAARTSVVSVLVAKKAATSAATSDISMKSTTPRGRLRRPRGVVDEIEMSDVAADVAAFLATSTDTTDVLAADTTDVLSAAKAASDGRIKIGPSK